MIPPPTTIQSAQGFSFLELMLVVLILGIITTMGTQTYVQLVKQSRASTAINELFYHLAYARSEAIKRNSPITVCARGNATTCLKTHLSENWTHGYIIFEDKNDDKQRQESEALILVQGKIHKDDKLYYKPSASGAASGHGILQFTPLGFTYNNPSSFLYCPNGELKYAKTIVLNRIGRLRIAPP